MSQRETMILNSQVLDDHFVVWNNRFANGIASTPTEWAKIASREETEEFEIILPWVDGAPMLREFVSERIVKQYRASSFKVSIKRHEATVQISADDYDTNKLEKYGFNFAAAGGAAAKFYDKLVFEALVNGDAATSLGYDGVPFFSNNHPVYDKDGNETGAVQSNINSSGNKPYWFLLDTSGIVKPIILWVRRDPYARPDSANQREYDWHRRVLYLVDAQAAASYGFWESAYASNEELTPENLMDAWTIFASRNGHDGYPIGLKPTTLVTSYGNMAGIQSTIQAALVGQGNTNTTQGIVTPIITQWAFKQD